MMTTNDSKRVVIAGGSGFLGLSLAFHLAERGWDVTILSRHAPKPAGPWRHVPWDARSLGDWNRELDGTAGLINLTGRNVDCLKTPDHQDEILRSRVEATRVLGQAMRTLDRPPPVWVQMSTAHIYGDPPKVWCDEESPAGVGLAPTVGLAWEAAFREAVLPSQSGVVLRTSFVLGRDCGASCGALRRLLPLARLGLAGRIASGRQGMSWIHELDLNRLFERALVDPSMKGTYVASAPNPVPQIEFMRSLRGAVNMPIGLPASSWMLRLMVRFALRTDPDLALYGRYVVSKRLAAEGFAFEFPTLDEALGNLLARRKPNRATPPRQSTADEVHNASICSATRLPERLAASMPQGMLSAWQPAK